MKICVYHEARTEMMLGTIDLTLVPDVPLGSSVMMFATSNTQAWEADAEIAVRVRLARRDGELVAWVWDEHALGSLPTFRRTLIAPSGLLGTDWLTPHEALTDPYIKEGGVVALLIDSAETCWKLVSTEDTPQWRTVGRWQSRKMEWSISGWNWEDQEWCRGIGTVIGVMKLPDEVGRKVARDD